MPPHHLRHVRPTPPSIPRIRTKPQPSQWRHRNRLKQPNPAPRKIIAQQMRSKVKPHMHIRKRTRSPRPPGHSISFPDYLARRALNKHAHSLQQKERHRSPYRPRLPPTRPTPTRMHAPTHRKRESQLRRPRLGTLPIPAHVFDDLPPRLLERKSKCLMPPRAPPACNPAVENVLKIAKHVRRVHPGFAAQADDLRSEDADEEDETQEAPAAMDPPPPTRSNRAALLPPARPAPAATSDAIASLFGLGDAATKQHSQPLPSAPTAPPTPSPAPLASAATPVRPPDPSEAARAERAETLLFRIQLAGPGINTQLDVVDADDLTLVRALLDKIERRLKQ